MTQPGPARTAVGTLAVVVVAVSLGHLYQAIGKHSGLNSWQAAASLHTGLAAIVLWLAARRGQLGALLARPAQRWAYIPAVAIAVGAALLAATSAILMPPSESAPHQSASIAVAFVVWIPLIEELVFRVGLGGVARAHLGNVWGAWLSAVAFAIVHTAPTIPNLVAAKVGLPLGPFLLALACEALFIKTRRLWPIVLLHAACNGTVFIFSVLDSRWLHWLGLLYL